MSIYLVTAPGTEPVSVEEQIAHSRLSIHDDDAYLSGVITAARKWCEVYLNRQFVTATYRMKLDSFCIEHADEIPSVPYSLDEIELPWPPLQAVSSITYYDASNTSQTLATSVYEVDTDRTPGIVRLKALQSWPTTYYRRAAVTINFTAGYGGAAATDAQSVTAVPANIKHAIKLLAGYYYENREGNLSDAQLVTVKNLLSSESWGCYA